jgi:conjugal transfer pilus assembly protein TrbC
MPEFKGKGSCQVAIENLQTESNQKLESLKKTHEFQEIIAELQNNGDAIQSSSLESGSHLEQSLFGPSLSKAPLYIFVSFSMGEKALLNLAYDAKRYGAILVLRGFLDGSYRKTALELQKVITTTGQGVLVDPELYTLFDISAVPTFVLAKLFPIQSQDRTQTPIYDMLQGHVSVQYTLKTFEKEGDLKQEAHLLLERSTMP